MPSSEIVTYCTIGNRAAQAWFALTALLGHEHVRVFYDSYVDWGMDPASPVAT
jgi:thiosulfate/3-mercaptopyruvate sulfurtransferase